MSSVTVKITEAGDFWEKEDDALTDLLTMSAFTDEKKFVLSVRKPNVGVVKKPVKKSIFDDISSDEELSEAANGIRKEKEERKKKVAMGRGYVAQKYQQRHVGNCSPTALEETERSIREIYPVGFSNEVIEAAYNNPAHPAVVPERMEQLRFRPASSNSSSSSIKKETQTAQDDDTTSNSSTASYKPNCKQEPISDDTKEFPKL